MAEVNDTCIDKKENFKIPVGDYLLVEVDYTDVEAPNFRSRVFRCPLCDVIEVKPTRDSDWAKFVKARVDEVHVSMTADPDWQRVAGPITQDEYENTAIDIHYEFEEHLKELDGVRPAIRLANNREVV